MGVVQRLVVLVVGYVMVLVFGVPVLLSTLWRIVRDRKKFFYRKQRTQPPSCLEDESLGEHGFITLQRQGIKLHYVAAGSGDNPLMVLVHGFPEFWYSWRHQIREFKRSYRVVAIDMRGYGESDQPCGVGEYRIDKLRADIKELVETMGYTSCTLVGHDWGGAVVWSTLIAYPHLASRAILMNCPHPAAFQVLIKRKRAQILKSWYMFVFQLPYLPELLVNNNDFKMLELALTGKESGAKAGTFTDDDVEAFKYTFSLGGTCTNAINYYRANLLRQVDSQAKLRAQVTVPTLMIWGDGDKFLDAELPVISGQFVEDYQVKFIEGASHWVQQEEPEKCNEMMWAFLNR